MAAILYFPKPKQVAWGTIGAQKLGFTPAPIIGTLAFGFSRFMDRLVTP
jgi:hypothetical protein